MLLEHQFLVKLLQLLVSFCDVLHDAIVLNMDVLLLAGSFDSSNGLIMEEIVGFNIHDLLFDVLLVLACPALVRLASYRLQVLSLAVFFSQEVSHHGVCFFVRLSGCYKLLLQNRSPLIVVTTLVTWVLLLLLWGYGIFGEGPLLLKVGCVFDSVRPQL